MNFLVNDRDIICKFCFRKYLLQSMVFIYSLLRLHRLRSQVFQKKSSFFVIGIDDFHSIMNPLCRQVNSALDSMHNVHTQVYFYVRYLFTSSFRKTCGHPCFNCSHAFFQYTIHGTCENLGKQNVYKICLLFAAAICLHTYLCVSFLDYLLMNYYYQFCQIFSFQDLMILYIQIELKLEFKSKGNFS